MGIFSPENMELESNIVDQDQLMETYIYDELSRLSDEKRKEFIQSEACQTMINEGLVSRRTIVRLSKNDDLERRITMAAMAIAKQKNDPLYYKLAKNRVKERELLGKIRTKYGSKGERVAKVGQKKFLKGKIIPNTFVR